MTEAAHPGPSAVRAPPPVPGLVSVVIPAYNAQRWIPEALRSVLAQEHESLEAIVVDDGSTDGTAGEVARIARADPRVRLLSFPNGGLARARNRGLAAARGEFVSFLDADDLWHPAKLRRQFERVGARTGAVALCGLRRFVDRGHGREWLHETAVPKTSTGRDGVRDVLFLRNDQMAIFTTALLRTDELRALGGFREGAVSAEDWELWLRATRTLATVAVDEPLYYYRKHANSLTTATPLALVLDLQLALIARERDAGNVTPQDAERATRDKLLEFACAAEWRRERRLAARLVARGLVRHGGARTLAYYRTACGMAARAAGSLVGFGHPR